MLRNSAREFYFEPYHLITTMRMNKDFRFRGSSFENFHISKRNSETKNIKLFNLHGKIVNKSLVSVEGHQIRKERFLFRSLFTETWARLYRETMRP